MQFLSRNICEAGKKKEIGVHSSLRSGTREITGTKPLKYINIEPRIVENKHIGIIFSIYGKFMIQLV